MKFFRASPFNDGLSVDTTYSQILEQYRTFKMTEQNSYGTVPYSYRHKVPVPYSKLYVQKIKRLKVQPVSSGSIFFCYGS